MIDSINETICCNLLNESAAKVTKESGILLRRWQGRIFQSRLPGTSVLLSHFVAQSPP
jgi:hypothetical protein